MKHEPTEQLHCWHFYLTDEPPGPAFGDAAEFVERLGCDPWSFTRIEPGAETIFGAVVTTEFVVTGSREQLEVLRAAHAQHTGSTLPAPQPVAPAATGTKPQ